MTLIQIYDRMDCVLERIKAMPGDEAFISTCEMELDSLEQIREEMDEWV